MRSITSPAVSAACAARVAPVLLSAALPYARPGDGLGRVLVQTGWGRCAVAVALAAAVCVDVAGWHGAILLAVAVLLVAPAIVVAGRWLGGLTGDVLGAATELAELAMPHARIAVLARQEEERTNCKYREARKESQRIEPCLSRVHSDTH